MLPLPGVERGKLKQLPHQAYSLLCGKHQVVQILRLALRPSS